MASDPRIPIGMSRCGFFDSCAAVETASNPLYAKNLTPAQRRMRDHPKCPNDPVFGGMNGDRLSRLTYAAPATTKMTRTIDLITTRTVLVFADWRMPMINNAA